MAHKPSAVLEAEPIELEGATFPPATEVEEAEDAQIIEVAPKQKAKPTNSVKTKQGGKSMSAKIVKLTQQVKDAQTAAKAFNDIIKVARTEVKDAKAAAKEPMKALQVAERELAKQVANKEKAMTKIEAAKGKLAEAKEALTA